MSTHVTASGQFYIAEPTRGIRRLIMRRRAPHVQGEARLVDPAALGAQTIPPEESEPQTLPAGGERGAEAGRSLRRFRAPAHRATSNVVAGAYPFLAEAGLGVEGVYVGQDAWSGGAFCFDPWVLYQRGVLTNPNCVLAGVVGKGKSCLAKSLATRSIALGRRVYVPGDPKGEWSAVAEAVGGASIQLGGSTSHRLNPLDSGIRDARLNERQWAVEVAKRRRVLIGSLAASTLGRPLRPVEHTALDAALEQATQARVPTLPMVVDAVLSPSTSLPGATTDQLSADGRDVGHALRRLVAGDLAGLFDAETSVTFDPTLPMLTLDLSRITGSDQLLALVMTCASAWMEAALADPGAGARWVIYDEAWRLMRQPALLARMQAQWKLSRGLGIANLLVIHRLSDLDAVGDTGSEARALARGLLGDCSTKIVYQQEVSESAHTATQLGLTAAERAMLPDLLTGEGLWRVGNRAFVVRHTATPEELRVFDTNQRMRIAI